MVTAEYSVVSSVDESVIFVVTPAVVWDEDVVVAVSSVADAVVWDVAVFSVAAAVVASEKPSSSVVESLVDAEVVCVVGTVSTVE